MKKGSGTCDAVVLPVCRCDVFLQRRIVGALAPICLALAAFSACNRPGQAGIQSDDPNERILAIRAAAIAKDMRSLPLIVDRLEDEDEAVRFYAIIALDRMTGERFGYDYAKPAEVRAKAVERWRMYMRRRGKTGSEAAGDRRQDIGGPPATVAGSPEPIQ